MRDGRVLFHQENYYFSTEFRESHDHHTRETNKNTMKLVLSTLCLMASVMNARGDDDCIDEEGHSGPCEPGREFCGEPFANAPVYHLMDQHGCGENDPNGPIYDPVHGVLHHFYQIHLHAPPGHGPDYGHFVSKDFVHWAALPVAIWNGIDKSHPEGTEGYITKYDNEAIFTGSGVLVDGAAPDGKGKGIVQIYPGLCNKDDWPTCSTGTLLAQAVPADYEADELLTNWTKPSYNPIMENTQRDPSTPWKTPSGEWRLRTYDSKVYGSASDADLLAGTWYEIGVSSDFRTCECPSFYPLPAATPGFEKSYEERKANNDLPTHVHKTSCGGDWWQLGTYEPGTPKVLGRFTATPGWEDTFAQRRIDYGNFYASKDNLYPTKSGGERRVNWGWAMVPPASTQTLPREITFNPDARCLQQAPIAELTQLRGTPVYSAKDLTVTNPVTLDLKGGIAKQSEVVASFAIPDHKTTFGLSVGVPGGGSGTPVTTYMEKTDMPGNDYNVTHYPANTDPKTCEAACLADEKCMAWTYVVRGSPVGSGDCCLKSDVPCPVTSGGASAQCTSGAREQQTLPSCGSSNAMDCTIAYEPPADPTKMYNVTVSCGSFKDDLRILPDEKSIEVRMYTDATFVETFFQQGRVAITSTATVSNTSDVTIVNNDGSVVVDSIDAYPIESIWVSEKNVRDSPRVFK